MNLPATATGLWQATELPGVLRARLQRHADDRGSFTELWRSSWLGSEAPSPFVQANLSRSRAGVLRGLHFHARQADLWIVVDGHAFVALVDLRDAVAGHGEPRSVTMDLSPDDALYIPPLVAHGFYARTDLALTYLVTEEFDGSDEHGFAWDDRIAGITWPARDPVLSGRDALAPPLGDVVAELRRIRDPRPA